MSHPLSQLRDIHLPDPISWWPPAPGWWLLAATGLLLLLILVAMLYQRYRARAYRRSAIRELERCYRQWRQCGGAADYPRHMNSLLKRTAMVAYGRTGVAALNGVSWYAFLDRQHRPRFEHRFSSSPAMSAIYSGQSQPADIEALHRLSRHWLAHHGSEPCWS